MKGVLMNRISLGIQIGHRVGREWEWKSGLELDYRPFQESRRQIIRKIFVQKTRSKIDKANVKIVRKMHKWP